MNRSYWIGLLKDWGVALLVVALAFGAWSWVMTPRPKSDGPAPAFALQTTDGKVVSLADFDDEVVVLNFWFTTCGPCRHEIPELARFHTANPDVPLLGISVDQGLSLDKLNGRSKKLGINYPVLYDDDSRVSLDYGVQIFPTTILLRNGEIVQSKIGEVNERSLSQMVQAAAQ